MAAAATRRPRWRRIMGRSPWSFLCANGEWRVANRGAYYSPFAIRYSPASSLDLDAGLVDHLAPARGLARDQRGQVLGRAADRRHAEVREPPAHLRVLHHHVERGIELGDDRGWR